MSKVEKKPITITKDVEVSVDKHSVKVKSKKGSTTAFQINPNVTVSKKEGFIDGYNISEDDGKKVLQIAIKYFQNKPVISEIKKVSKCGLRIYRSKDKLPKIMNDLGVAIISTSKGVMSSIEAKKQGLGGEVLFYIM